MIARPLPRQGRTGVRITGDYYQWLLVWHGCVTMLRDHVLRVPNPIVGVGVEADDAGNLDDIIFRRMRPPHCYMQVKYTVDNRTPVNTDYLTKPSKTGGHSILRKIADTYLHLLQHGHPVELALVTNRAPDPTDFLIAGRDARTQLLIRVGVDKLGRSDRAAREAWAREANLTDEQLLDLLGVLRFEYAKGLPDVENTVSLLMQVAGLRGDQQAVRSGADWVAQQVRDGRQELDLDMIREAVKILNLSHGPARAILSIATLKPDALVDQAIHQLEWFERFAGDDAFTKRRPAAPATWAHLQHDIEEIPHHLGPVNRVAVTGSLRQATAFALGATLRMVTNIDLAVAQRDQLWTSNDDYDRPIEPAVIEHEVGQGTEIALAVEVATQLTDDVLAYLHEAKLPVAKLVVLQPLAGPKDRSIPDTAFANAFAVGIRDQARRSVRGHARLHLFLAGPMGLAMLLGHRWNRVAPTVVYEEVLTDTQYEPAFTVSA
jgi:hypothetical protein